MPADEGPHGESLDALATPRNTEMPLYRLPPDTPVLLMAGDLARIRAFCEERGILEDFRALGIVGRRVDPSQVDLREEDE